MSASPDEKRRRPTPGADAEEGPEAAGGQLPVDPELEAALREAAEAVGSGERAASPAARAARRKAEEVLLTDPDASESYDEEIQRVRNDLTDARDRLLRLQADFDNFRKRALREREETLRYGHQNLVKDLLGTVDNLDRAIEHAQQNEGGDLQNLLQGVELVRRELLVALAKHGVHRVESQGKPFDPAVHEAMAQRTDASVPPNTVVDTLQVGYTLRDRLLRPARVVVAKAPDDPEGC